MLIFNLTFWHMSSLCSGGSMECCSEVGERNRKVTGTSQWPGGLRSCPCNHNVPSSCHFCSLSLPSPPSSSLLSAIKIKKREKCQKIQSEIKEWLLALRWGADQTKHQHCQPLKATKQTSSLWILVGQPAAGCVQPKLSSGKANTECERLSHTHTHSLDMFKHS